MAEDRRKIWMRLGASLSLTEEEADILMTLGDPAGAVIHKVIEEGRVKLDGESYIPASSIADCNEQYGAAYNDDADIGYLF